ncbi:MAG: HAMP domain-containing sensor histidine kinase [Chloroflexota bacterium]
MTAGHDPTDALIARTGRRLALYTLLLVAALLIAVGAVTALVATRLMHQNIQRGLETAVAGATLSDEDADRRSTTRGDSFVLLLDAEGTPLLGSETPPLDGLPDLQAVGAAAANGRDAREGTYAGEHVQLLTVPVTIPGHEDTPAIEGFAQAGVRLRSHDQQEQLLLLAIAVTSALGILGAGLVTLLVTRRAMAPIRTAFATERRFVAAASHELRTPVAIVRASAEILERESLITDDGRPLVADIVAEADRMGLLVADLLTLAKAEAGALPLERRPIDLVPWLTGLAHRVETMAAGAGLALDTQLPAGGSVVVDADEDRLSQLVLILVDNAVEHSPAGGTIGLELAVAGGKATIGVRDQGPGVPVAERERIFEPFARLPGRRRTGSGSGLGLAIAQQLAGRHGAQLSVEDAPGGGARFTVRLPLAHGGAATVPAGVPGS